MQRFSASFKTPFLLALALLTLSGCATSVPSSRGLRVPPLDPRLAQACTSPQSLLSGSYPQIVGAMGVALIQCGQRQQAAVKAYDGLAKAVIGK